MVNGEFTALEGHTPDHRREGMLDCAAATRNLFRPSLGHLITRTRVDCRILSLMVAAAPGADRTTLYSEDLPQAGGLKG